MKFLKNKNISKFGLTDQTLFSNQFGRTVMNGAGGLMLPKGTTSQRPQPTNTANGGASGAVRVPNGNNGYIRYNTTTHAIEAYINGVWETVRASGTNAITKQTIGPGNFGETKFGPLNSSFVYSFTANPDNIIVIVGNVFQISGTNYTIEQNPAGNSDAGGYLGGAPYPAGYYLTFNEPVPINTYVTVYYGYAN